MSDSPPRGAVAGIAGGLVLMAVFTLWWSSLVVPGWRAEVARPVFAAGAAASLVFLAAAFRLFRAMRRFTATGTPQDAVRGKRMGIAFGIVFGLEGLVIGVVARILTATGRDDYMVPAVALVVGLHFYPMAPIFGRTVDYWIATWVVVVAVSGLVAVSRAGGAVAPVWSAVGLGVAVATGAYGAYMMRVGQDLLRVAPTT